MPRGVEGVSRVGEGILVRRIIGPLGKDPVDIDLRARTYWIATRGVRMSNEENCI